MNINRKHKNSLFSALFSNPDALRELYSAIEGVDIPQDASININTLSDALFMGQINDVSFTINNKIVVLIEHQSSINDNIPVRLLMYIGRVYEKILDREKLYQRKLVKIPTPEFIVLYNGKDPYPDRKELRLSDAFMDIEDMKACGASVNSLELTVQVYNINHGRNPELLEKSRTLFGYSCFVDKVREYSKDFSLEESVKAAIKYCIANEILIQFMKNHGSEVINMLFDEISIDRIIEIRVNEAVEDIIEEAVKEAVEEAVKEAVSVAVQNAQEEALEEKLEIARNLLAEGSSHDFVQKITGLSIDEIQRL